MFLLDFYKTCALLQMHTQLVWGDLIILTQITPHKLVLVSFYGVCIDQINCMSYKVLHNTYC